MLRAPDAPTAPTARRVLLDTMLAARHVGRARTTVKLWRIRAALRLVSASVGTMVAGAVVDTIWRW